MKPLKLITSLLTLACVSLLFGPLAAGLVTVLGMFGGVGAGSFGVTLDVAALRTAFGSYYIDGGQNESDLYTRLFWGSEIDELFEARETEDTQLRGAIANLTGGPQPFQVAFTEKGTLSFTPQLVTLYNIKDDRSFYPHEVQADWIGFLGPKNKQTELTCPLPRYLTENLILPVFEEGMETLEAYAGVYAAPTAGTAGPDGTSMNGIKKVINLGVAATTISTISTGAFAADPEDFMIQIEDFAALIEAKDLAKSQMTIAMSLTNAKKYRRGKKEYYNSAYEQSQDLYTIEDHPNIRVKGYAALGSSDKIFCSPMTNSRVGIKRNEHQSKYQFEQQDRKIKMWTDFWKGYGWIDHSRVYTNDLELS